MWLISFQGDIEDDRGGGEANSDMSTHNAQEPTQTDTQTENNGNNAYASSIECNGLNNILFC